MTELQPIDFADPGADDSEPAKGVTNGYLRLWHDAFHDMEERYHAEHRTVARVWEALGISTFEQAGGLTIFEIVARQRSALEALEKKLIRVHRALDDALGDSDVTHVESDGELRRQYPTQWASEQLAKIIDDL